MSREIKFRAWNKEQKEFIPWSKLIWNSQGLLNALHNAGTHEHYGNWIAQQYTGLKDKNGVEIYEGDIVRILYSGWLSKFDSDPRTLDQYLQDIAVVGTIIFDPYHGYLLDGIGGVSYGPHGFIEVIGNIWENKELLK